MGRASVRRSLAKKTAPRPIRSQNGGTTAVSSEICGRDRARPSRCYAFNVHRLLTFAFALMVSGGAITAVADNNLTRDSDYDYDPPVPASYSLPVVKPAADGALLDSDGKSLNLRDLTHGRITVLSFIYTRCT